MMKSPFSSVQKREKSDGPKRTISKNGTTGTTRGDVVGDILSRMTKFYDTIPSKKATRNGSATAVAETNDHVAHPLMNSSCGAISVPLESMDRCRNSECNCTVFEFDGPNADKVCKGCGVVQNNRALESYAEEKRSFADDEGGRDKHARTTSVDDRQAAHHSTEMGKKTTRKEFFYADKNNPEWKRDKAIRTLMSSVKAAVDMSQLEIPADAYKSVLKNIELFYNNQLKHDEVCGNPGGCRCSNVFKTNDIKVQLALLDISMKELKTPLTKAQLLSIKAARDASHLTETMIFATRGKMMTLLKGQPFPCTDLTKVENPDEIQFVTRASDEEAELDEASSKYFGWFSHIEEYTDLKYCVIPAAKDLIKEWVKKGVPPDAPQTVVTVAVMKAQEKLSKDYGGRLEKVTLSHICETLDKQWVTEETVRKALGDVRYFDA